MRGSKEYSSPFLFFFAPWRLGERANGRPVIRGRTFTLAEGVAYFQDGSFEIFCVGARLARSGAPPPV